MARAPEQHQPKALRGFQARGLRPLPQGSAENACAKEAERPGWRV